jgi:hypothetical protein
MMVVIPTEKNVKLKYSSTGIDKLAYLLTLVGIGIVIFWWRRGPYRYGTSMPPLM